MSERLDCLGGGGHDLRNGRIGTASAARVASRAASPSVCADAVGAIRVAAHACGRGGCWGRQGSRGTHSRAFGVGQARMVEGRGDGGLGRSWFGCARRCLWWTAGMAWGADGRARARRDGERGHENARAVEAAVSTATCGRVGRRAARCRRCRRFARRWPGAGMCNAALGRYLRHSSSSAKPSTAASLLPSHRAGFLASLNSRFGWGRDICFCSAYRFPTENTLKRPRAQYRRHGELVRVVDGQRAR